MNQVHRVVDALAAHPGVADPVGEACDSSVNPRNLNVYTGGIFMKITRLASQLAASAARSIITAAVFGRSRLLPVPDAPSSTSLVRPSFAEVSAQH